MMYAGEWILADPKKKTEAPKLDESEETWRIPLQTLNDFAVRVAHGMMYDVCDV